MPDLTAAVLTDAGGAHLDAYFAALAQTEQVRSVVVADPGGTSETLARKTLGAKLTHFERDHRKTLTDHQPGLAVVTLEAVSAPPVVQAALDANCHVLAEKPSCVKGEDFEALGNRVRGTVQAARKMIQTGQIGQIYGCELHIVADQTRLKSPTYHQSWLADRTRSGGGHLMWLGIHWIDLVMHLTDSQIVETAGFTGIVGGQPLKTEDSAAMALRFDNGTFGTITSGYYLDRGYHSHLKIWGAHGWLSLEPHGGEALQWYSTKEASPQVRKYDGPADEAIYAPFVQACVRASLDLAPPPITAAQGLHALKTVFACYRAAETGRSQSVG
jgi:predicted dehydrogenase